MPDKKETPEMTEEQIRKELRAKVVADEEKYLAEKVLIQLPKDNNEYKDDVTVCINGKIWQIQRGIQVAVPRSVANVLAQSSYQMMVASEKAEALKDVNYSR